MKRRRTKSPGVSFFAFQDIITAVVGIFILITLILVLELAERVEKATAGPTDTEDLQPILTTIETQREEVQALRQQYAELRKTSLGTVDVNSFNRAEKIEELQDHIAVVKAKQASLDQQVRELQIGIDAANSEQRRLKRINEELAGKRQLAKDLEKQLEQLKAQTSRLAGDKTEIYRDTVEDGSYLTLLTLESGSVTVRDAESKSVQNLAGPSRVKKFEDWLENKNIASKHFMIFVEPGGAPDFVKVRELLDSNRARYGYTVVAADQSVKLGFEMQANSKQGPP